MKSSRVNKKQPQIVWLIAFLLVYLGISGQPRAQDVIKLDSLQGILNTAKQDTIRYKTLMAIAELYNGIDYEKSLSLVRQARELAVENDWKKHIARGDVAIGNICIFKGDYKSAATHFFEALKYYESVDDKDGLASINNNLGATFDRLQEFDKALEYYFKSQNLINQYGTNKRKSEVLPSLYNNIANIYQSKADPVSALQYYEKALALTATSQSIRDKTTQGKVLNNIGKLYLNDLKQPEKAISYLEKGLKVREELGDSGEVARSLIFLSDFFLQTKQYEKSRAHVLRALEIGKEIGSLDVLKHASDCHWQLENTMGRYREALVAHQFHKKITDSIQNQQATSEITKLQLQYDFEKAEKARELKSEQSRFRYLTTIVILSSLLVVAVLLTLFIRTKARQTELKRKNLAQDIEIKNKELTTNVMYLVRKNELINSVAERLLPLQRNTSSENKKIIQDIIIDLQREGDNDSWKEFELRFNQVHSEFYSTLRKLYPDLSPADEKLCAFLRLNMSSKEIAAITQQSIKSVEVARSRLRKKLNLTNTSSNLVTHLANL